MPFACRKPNTHAVASAPARAANPARSRPRTLGGSSRSYRDKSGTAACGWKPFGYEARKHARALNRCLLQHFVDLGPAVSLVGLPGGAYRHATGTALEAAWLLLPTIPTFQLAATTPHQIVPAFEHTIALTRQGVFG
jgi:hypothetical protein